MIVADSNVFIRWIIGDDKGKAARVSQFLKQAEKDKTRVWVPDVVVSEMVWVLDSFYGLKPPEIREMLEPLLDAPMLEFENRGRLVHAMELFGAHGVDFTDCYVAAFANERSAAEVLSYDRDFDRLSMNRREP